MSKPTIIILFLFTVLTNGMPQNNVRQSYTIKGVVLDSQSLKPIAFAHIFNESRKYGFIADSSGNFISNMKIGDTLVFIALGYLGKKHIVAYGDTLFLRILAEPQRYDIEEVSVAIPRTYDDFKEAFMKVDVNEGKPLANMLPQHNPYIIPTLLDTNVIDRVGYRVMHPITSHYYRKNKNEIAKRKVWELKEQEIKQPTVDKKYNKDIVAQVTGLESHDVLNFMLWCNFNFNYLFESTPLEIVEAIDEKFVQYKKCCYKEKVLNNYTLPKKP